MVTATWLISKTQTGLPFVVVPSEVGVGIVVDFNIITMSEDDDGISEVMVNGFAREDKSAWRNRSLAALTPSHPMTP